MNITQDMIEFAKTMNIEVVIGNFDVDAGGVHQEVVIRPFVKDALLTPVLFHMNNYCNKYQNAMNIVNKTGSRSRFLDRDDKGFIKLKGIIADENDFKAFITSLSDIINQPHVKNKINNAIKMMDEDYIGCELQSAKLLRNKELNARNHGLSAEAIRLKCEARHHELNCIGTKRYMEHMKKVCEL
ncbi:hypothetical protein [Photorhabdus luminescens]|uniref:Uncharacterized protein n=1 Tax=Photorhabdus luminescens subsp. mexicana TaxID=2100167 RepID=A0A4R4IQK3_PHOLU|nr:hypothetical protein [Photorhabdus luminescens]TDB42651.1 hypothetical protein C5468_24520 [Photorhabdus luminescens subsp. mexicana]